MRVLVTDLDRTLTGPDLALDPRAVDRIRLLRAAGVLVVVASGRRLEHLLHLRLEDEADALVAEDGAVLCVPARMVLEVRAPRFVDAARDALGPLAASFVWGRAIGSGPRALAEAAHACLAARGVPHGRSFNVDEVMILPPGVDKASGVRAALRHLGVVSPETWAIGDGENDLPLFAMAKVSGAPAHAPEKVRARTTTRLAASHADAFLAFTRPLLARPDARTAPLPDARGQRG